MGYRYLVLSALLLSSLSVVAAAVAKKADEIVHLDCTGTRLV